MPRTTIKRRASDAALRRIPIVRAVGGPAEVRDAAKVLDQTRRDAGVGSTLRDIALAIPWIVMLLTRLARDRRVALRHRIAIVGATAYLLFPFDPIPDFLPVIGALDDALVVLVVMRWVVRSVDSELLAELWSGTPEMLDAVRALAGAARG